MIKFNDNYNVEELTQKDPRKDKRYYELRLANKNIIDKYDSLSTGASKTFKNILIQNLIEVIQNDREYKYSQNSPVKERIDKMIKTFLSQKDKSDDDDKSGDDKSGDDKSGHDESDDDESGDDESGDDESGHDESGVKSSDVSESDSEHCKYMGVDKNFKYSKDGAQARIGSDEICGDQKTHNNCKSYDYCGWGDGNVKSYIPINSETKKPIATSDLLNYGYKPVNAIPAETASQDERLKKPPLGGGTKKRSKRKGTKHRKTKRKGKHSSSKRKTKGGNHAKQTRRRKKNRTTKTKGPPNGIITKAWIKKQCPCRDGDNCIACPGDLKKYKDGRKH